MLADNIFLIAVDAILLVIGIYASATVWKLRAEKTIPMVNIGIVFSLAFLLIFGDPTIERHILELSVIAIVLALTIISYTFYYKEKLSG